MDLSICITYYGALDHLIACLASIRDSETRCAHEVIVVDDASPLPCKGRLAAEFPDVRVITNAENVGFAASSNVAIEAARAGRVLLLNSDTELSKGAADRLFDHLTEHHDVAAAGPRILNGDGTLQPQCRRGKLTPLSGLAYVVGLDRLFPANRRLGEYLLRYEDPDRNHDVKALSGACMMVRREAFEQIGGFDELFFLYGEDLDWCYRLGATGRRIVYVADARVIHHGGKGGTSHRFLHSLYHYHRSLWLVLRRHATSPLFPLYGWLAAVFLAARFALLAPRALSGSRRVGSRKGHG